MKEFVIVAGYVASGSSVVCDLLQEVQGVGALMGGKELKLIKEPYGMIDLEKALLDEDWNWWKCNEAIKLFVRFYKMVCDPKYNVYDYSKIINEDFAQLTDDFVGKIVDFTFEPGTSMAYLLENFWNEKKENRVVRKIRNRFNRKNNCPEFYFSGCTSEQYKKAATDYISKLFSGKYWDRYDRICLDQALYPLDGKYLHDYFPKGKLITVSRHPLDQLASLMERKKGIGIEMLNRPDPEKYIAWLMRQKRNLPKGDDILYCSYEDLILDYNKWAKKIFDFCGIDPSEHTDTKRYFDPNVSKTRIGKWKNYLDHPKYGELFEKLKIAMDEGRLY